MATPAALHSLSGAPLSRLPILLLLLLAPSPCDARWRGKGGGGRWVRVPASPSAPATPASHDFDSADCSKCMTVVMRLLSPVQRGCPAANASLVTSTNVGRVPTAYCDTLLPKKRACVAYSFGLDGTWDFDKVCTFRQHARAACRPRTPTFFGRSRSHPLLSAPLVRVSGDGRQGLPCALV